MVEIELDVIKIREQTCSLDKNCFTERIEELQKSLFTRAKYFEDKNGIFQAKFGLKEGMLKEIIEFLDYENNCCGDFDVNLHINMREKEIDLVLK